MDSDIVGNVTQNVSAALDELTAPTSDNFSDGAGGKRRRRYRKRTYKKSKKHHKKSRRRH